MVVLPFLNELIQISDVVDLEATDKSNHFRQIEDLLVELSSRNNPL